MIDQLSRATASAPLVRLFAIVSPPVERPVAAQTSASRVPAGDSAQFSPEALALLASEQAQGPMTSAPPMTST